TVSRSSAWRSEYSTLPVCVFSMVKPDPKPEIEQLISTALAARSAGDLAFAEQCYLKIVELDADHHGALHNLGVIANLTGRLSRAAAWYDRALRARPGAADPRTTLGAFLKDLGDVDLAATHLVEAIRLEPRHAAAHANLGSVRM